MKKRKRLRGLFIYILMIVIIFASPANVSKAATSQKLVYAGKTVNYKKYSVKYSINGKNIKQNKTKGVILNNNAMGYYVDVVKKGLKAECVYDKTAKKLTITKFENTIELTMDSKVAYVNGKKKKMSFPMTKVKYADKGISRIMVPVRFVAENLGYKYTWNSSSKTGTITYSWLEYYDNNSWIKYTGTKVKVSYNGENISYGKMPGIILDSTVLLNAKKVFGNELGMDYVYDATNQTVTISDGLVTAIYTIGSKDVIVNGEVMSASVPVMRIMNQQDSKYYVMVPANFTANIFGYNYNWNRKTSTSEISDKEIVVENNTSAATGASIYFSLPSGVDQNSLIDEDFLESHEDNKKSDRIGAKVGGTALGAMFGAYGGAGIGRSGKGLLIGTGIGAGLGYLGGRKLGKMSDEKYDKLRRKYESANKEERAYLRRKVEKELDRRNIREAAISAGYLAGR